MSGNAGLLVSGTPRRHPGFHPLTVAGVERLTDAAVAVTFAIPDDLMAAFLRFRPGQHLTLRRHIDGEDVRQSYSICQSRASARETRTLRIASATITGGRMSTWLNGSVAPGDVVDVLAPLGDFTCPTDPALARHHVALAAGSGITPVLSLVTTVLEEEPLSRVTLIYGNRTRATVMFADELEALVATYGDRLDLVHVLSREDAGDELHTGRVDAGRLPRLLAAHAPVDTVDEWYVCGPTGMVDNALEVLEGAGVDAAHVHHEVFYTPPEEQPRPSASRVTDEPATATRARPAS